MHLRTCEALSSLKVPEETHSLEDRGSPKKLFPSLLPADAKIEIKGVTTLLGTQGH